MVGIIAEYNPFHNGHLYQINKIKEMFKGKTIVLVLAGNFLNRGDISVLDKWDKTRLALDYGVDLVLELPFVFACQSADFYAYAGVKILDLLKCEYLVFGSESDNIDKLIEISNREIDENILKENIKKGLNYPTSLARAIDSNIDTPNDLLGISYIKAIHKLNSRIIPITIKRTNHYHSLDTDSSIISASAIRKLIKENKDISNFVPSNTLKYIKNIDLNDYFPLLKHQIIIDDLTNYLDIDIKLNNRLKKVIMESQNIEELLQNTKTKNYSYNKIKRCLVHILCGLKNDLYDINYIRVLGFNNNGQKYLNKIKKEIEVPIITNFDSRLDLELQATKIYSLITKIDIKSELNKPIKKED